jgi:hypothetical protein
MFLGVSAGLIDGHHHKRLGAAWMLFEWAILRQTGQEREGIVCRGSVITHEQIANEMNCSPSSVRRWMRRLITEKYVRMERERYGFRLFVLNPKKFRASKLGQSEPLQSVQTRHARVSAHGQSKGIQAIEESAISEIPLQNNLTKLLKNNNTARTMKNACSFPSFPERDKEKKRQEVLSQADQIRAAYKPQPPCLGKKEADAFIQSCIDKTKGPVVVQ